MFNCQRCNDLGLWLTPQGIIAVCPNIQLGYDHPPRSEASLAIERAGISLARRGITVSLSSFRVARAIARFSTDKPCGREYLINHCMEWAGSQKLRHLHAIIEDLRCTWFLPVGSRKGLPHGYWICTDSTDFHEYFEAAKSAPIKQLTTLHGVAKANFPVFAHQLELEFPDELARTAEAASV